MGMYKITRTIDGKLTDIELTDNEVIEIHWKKEVELYYSLLKMTYGDEFTDEEYLNAIDDLVSDVFEYNITLPRAVELAYDRMLDSKTRKSA